MKKAICLLSGGLDSTVSLYVARSEGYEAIALSIEYGQRHFREISAARAIAQKYKIPHYVAAMSMPWKGSALLDSGIQLPKDRSEETMSVFLKWRMTTRRKPFAVRRLPAPAPMT